MKTLIFVALLAVMSTGCGSAYDNIPDMRGPCWSWKFELDTLEIARDNQLDLKNQGLANTYEEAQKAVDEHIADDPC